MDRASIDQLPLFEGVDAALVEAVSWLSYGNPFVRERVDAERLALGREYRDVGGDVWHFDSAYENNPNLLVIDERLEALLAALRPRLVARREAGERASEEERRVYRDLVLYWLYNRYQGRIGALIAKGGEASTKPIKLYPDFESEVEEWLNNAKLGLVERIEPAVCIAWFFQLRRAFHFIFRTIVGGSMPAARLRAAVWQSVFTYDMRRYRRCLFNSMGDITTLITGPSGTGKELVARAIGLSRFIPFDPARQAFAENYEGAFFALNLAALSPTLIESELFGHQRGAFTGAVGDRLGWFEVCPPLGSVFLDEIGEVEESIQVKLLRVLQTRTFQRLGDTADRRFEGKLLAATNRDLEKEMQNGGMREDFYYRLCSDLIRTPSLREQLTDSPGELHALVLTVTSRMVGAEEAEELGAEVEAVIERRLGPDYPWPGNFRELEQCVRNVMIRGDYRASRPASLGGEAALADEMIRAELDADALLSRYVTLVYHRSGSYLEASRRLGLDRRTVKAKVDEELLATFRS